MCAKESTFRLIVAHFHATCEQLETLPPSSTLLNDVKVRVLSTYIPNYTDKMRKKVLFNAFIISS